MAKVIKRHDIYKRVWHWSNLISAFVLMITGAFLFIPGLGEMLGQGFMKCGFIRHGDS